jgi:hypothetical protein
MGRVNHWLGDFLLARHEHVGAEAPQLRRFDGRSFQHVDGDGVARICR